MLQGPRQDSYRYAVTPGDEGDKKKKKKKGQKDMEELKQELTMDEHKIPITELYSRLNTDPTTVSDVTFAQYFVKKLKYNPSVFCLTLVWLNQDLSSYLHSVDQGWMSSVNLNLYIFIWIII